MTTPTFDAFEAALINHVQTWWPAAGDLVHEGGTIAPSTFAPANSGFAPGDDPFFTVEVLFSGSRLVGAARHHSGVLQTSLFVPTGWGTALIARMRDRVEAMWEAAAIAGFSPYATTPPISLPGSVVPPGFFGQRADTSFHWIADSA